MINIRVYDKDGKHIGYFPFTGSVYPRYVINKGRVYSLRPAYGLIQNPCYGELGLYIEMEIDDDID